MAVGTDLAFLNAKRFVEDLSSKTLLGFSKEPSPALQYSIIPDSSAETTQSKALLNASETTGLRWIDFKVCNGWGFSPRPSNT